MIAFRSFFASFFFLLVAGSIGGPGTAFLPSAAAAPMFEERSATEQDACSQGDMLQTIGDIFGDIEAGEMVWSGRPVPQSACLQLISYESDDVATYVNQLTSIFGSNFPSCAAEDSDRNTCKAIQAVFDAFVSLKEKGCSPIFRNYLPAWTNWYQNSTTCVPGSFDAETKEFSNPNGCNAFAVCDILTTVLTLSANQARTSTCGTTAMLTVLSRSGPVRALQLATELVWTGTTRFLQTAPCPYVYDLFPGVQPLPDPSASLEEACGANPSGDCQSFYNNFINGTNPESSPAFIQTPGIEFMFTQAFATSCFRHVTGGCIPEASQLIKQDFSNSAAVQAYQGTMPYGLQYYCRGMVDEDYECGIVDHPEPLIPWRSLNSASASYWLSWPNMTPQSTQQYWDEAVVGNFGKVTNFNAQRFVEGLLCSINPTGSLTTAEILSEAAQASVPFSPMVPRITESILNEMCSEASVNEQGVVVGLNAGPLQDIVNGQSPRIPQPCVTGDEPYCDHGATGTYPTCNHATVLPNNIYRIWTWGMVLELPKEVLIANATTGIGGSLCSFMVGKPSGGTEKPVEPTRCDAGVCNLFCNISDTSETESTTSESTIGNEGSSMGTTSTATSSLSNTDADPDETNGEAGEEETGSDINEETTSGSGAVYGRVFACIACFLNGVFYAV